MASLTMEERSPLPEQSGSPSKKSSDQGAAMKLPQLPQTGYLCSCR